MGLSDDQRALLRLLAGREEGYEDIAALKGNRNGLILDRSGSDVFLFREGAKERRCEAELVK